MTLRSLEDDMGRTREDRIRDLRDKADQLQARARLLVQQDEKKKRAMATRRRILMGACLEDLRRRGDVSEGQVLSWLDMYLVRDADRAAFGLPPLGGRPSIDRMANPESPAP